MFLLIQFESFSGIDDLVKNEIFHSHFCQVKFLSRFALKKFSNASTLGMEVPWWWPTVQFERPKK